MKTSRLPAAAAGGFVRFRLFASQASAGALSSIPSVSSVSFSSSIAAFHAIALGLYAAGPAMFLRFLAAYDAAGYGAISGKTSFGIYIGVALFAVALILDIIVLATLLKETDGKYVPKDELQIEYAKSIGAM